MDSQHFDPSPAFTSTHSTFPKTQVPASRTYGDLSSIHTSGAQVSAASLGFASSASDAASAGITDLAYRTNFRGLFGVVEQTSATDHRSTATLFGSVLQGGSRTFLDSASKAGWLLTHRGMSTILDRRRSARETGVDIAIALAVQTDFLECTYDPLQQEINLLTGDGDFADLVWSLTEGGCTVNIFGWRHSTSGRLSSAATQFIALDDHLPSVSFRATH